LLQEFDLHIFDRKGEDNLVEDHLYRVENIPVDPILINDSFDNEQLSILMYLVLEYPPHGSIIMLTSLVENLCHPTPLPNKQKNSMILDTTFGMIYSFIRKV
jgi:hypothetical protein